MTIEEKVLGIQAELKVPKNLFNKFGKYNYRNAEGILEAVKPLLKKYKVLLSLENEPVLIGDHYFLKCMATLVNAEEKTESIGLKSYVEMDFNHAGMSAEQRGGCGISYGYKYLLNGLFLLDDSKDPDSDEFHEQTTKTAPKAEQMRKGKPISDEQYDAIVDAADEAGVDLESVLKSAGFANLRDVPSDMAQALYGKLKAKSIEKGNKK